MVRLRQLNFLNGVCTDSQWNFFSLLGIATKSGLGEDGGRNGGMGRVWCSYPLNIGKVIIFFF